MANDNEGNKDVDPNIYEKKDIQTKQKNRTKNSQIKELPEEQKKLSFENIEQSKEEEVVNSLFQTITIEQNTIVTISDNLQLFSDAESKISVDSESEQPSHKYNILQYLMVVSVIIIILVLLLIFPKLLNS